MIYKTENVVVTCRGFFSIPSLFCTVMAVGVDNVLSSVDRPYESNQLGTASLASVPLSPRDRAKIAHGNAKRVPRM